LSAFEFFGELAMQKVIAHTKLARPFATECPFYALLEFEGQYSQVVEQAMTLFESCVEQGCVVDGVMSQSSQQAATLWRLREDISETIAPFTPYKNDISVLISHVPSFIADIDAIVTAHYPTFEVCWFGHIGDGNLHLNILKPANLSKDEFFAACTKVNVHVFETVQKYQGSISAEHGVGMTKKDYLHYTRSAAEIDYLKAIKTVFDPNGIMNPGKLFDGVSNHDSNH
jgi:FAD/FMN-containing dehydrogenase